MGNLILYPESFEFAGSGESNLFALYHFLEAGKHAREQKDVIHSTAFLYEMRFAWGQFATDFAFATWAQVTSNPRLAWMTQTIFQSLVSFFYQNPSGRSDFANIESFLEEISGDNAGLIGCSSEVRRDDFVFDLASWHSWKIKFFRENPIRFIWKAADDDFLPNQEFSQGILLSEISRHKKDAEMARDYNNVVGLAFHELIMRHKGHDISAYAVEIGGKVAEANYYKYEEQMSSKERELCGAARKIFSFIDRHGRAIYISIDHAHGMFEYHDSAGRHVGEYKFDGTYNSGPEDSHNLKCLS
ncbi:hypothetical protein FEM33_25210 [Dyadobacter flavalbus]|uniref:Uncharacterized protein n=1 Tax=Dyadobacter flavalbus TaxID=2579942 RepID=A0A5M8Q6P3_9BACT|nr:hypothetical protein [Dyadobacter flavalbus]KAA6431605.1 hypothetical protein FEM33_25210 [Dyadobacter flavalbus]